MLPLTITNLKILKMYISNIYVHVDLTYVHCGCVYNKNSKDPIILQ